MTADGSRFIVEMQKAEQEYFKDRSIYYATAPIREQAPKGNWNYHLDGVYTIGLLNFVFPDNEYPGDSFVHEVKLKDTDDNHIFYDKLTFVYLEMPKFNKREDELATMFDKWMFALHNLSRLLERPRALQERVFKHLFDQAEIAQFTPEERREYAESVKNYWDYNSTMKTAHKKGKAEGLAEGEAKGRAEGRAEAMIENAKKMKADNMPSELIAKYTGLSAKEIDSL